MRRRVNGRTIKIIAIVASVVIVVAVDLIGATLYSHSLNKKVAIATVATKVNTDPYIGWKTATLKYEEATFKYPGSWKLKDNSWVPANTPGLPRAWGDVATVTSPTGMSVYVDTGNEEFNNPAAGITVVSTQPISTLGGDYSLDFYTYDGALNPDYPDYAQQACVTATTTPGKEFGFINSKTLIQSAGQPGSAAQDFICIQYTNAPNARSVSAFKQDSSFKDARLIVESLKY